MHKTNKAFCLLFIILETVIGSDFQLVCPPGYVVQGQAVYTEKALWQADAQEGFLLCIVCDADSFLRDSVDVCLPRGLFNYTKFSGKDEKIPGFIIAPSTFIYRHASQCGLEITRITRVKNELFTITSFEDCIKRTCGIAFNTTNGTIKELAKLGTTLSCTRMADFPVDKNTTVVMCPSHWRLTGITHMPDFFNSQNYPRSCGLCSKEGDSSEIYVCWRNNMRSYSSYNAYHKCLRQPCEEGVTFTLPKDEEACGFQLGEGDTDQFQIIANTRLIGCNEREKYYADYSPFEDARWNPDAVHYVFGALNVILFLSVVLMAFKMVTNRKQGGKEMETVGDHKVQQMETKPSEKIISECVEHNVYYE